MDHETNKQEPSSTEGGEMKYKVGDSAWVLCEVTGFDRRTGQVKVSGPYGGNFWTMASECRPVEPAPKETTPKQPTQGQKLAERALKGIWAANHAVNETPVVKDSLTTESNSPEIPDSSNDPLAPSPCMDGVNADRFVDGVMEARGRTNDPVNPSHYKQGGIECIEAIKAALGEGFPDYLRGNVMKYLWRYKEKGGVEDLRKSAWYLDRLFKEVGE